MNKSDDYTLQMIFAYLPIMDKIRLERVCTKWKKQSQCSWNNFKKLDFRSKTWTAKHSLDIIDVEKSTFEKVINLCGKYLTSIDFSQSTEKGVRHYLNIRTIRNALFLCPNIEELQFFNIQSFRCGGRIACTCQKYEHKISQCLIMYKEKITKLGLDITILCDNQKDIVELFGALKKLKSLHLSNFQQIIYNKCLLKCLPFNNIEEIRFSRTKVYIYNTNLPYLVIPQLQNLKSIGVTDFIDLNESLVKVLLPCTNLKSFSLQNTRIADPNRKFLRFVSQLFHLEILNVEAAYELVDDEFLKAVTTNCLNLRKLNISSCNKLTDAGISSITSLQKLRSLSMNYLEEVTSPPSPEKLYDLKKLDCSFCKNLKYEPLCNFVQKAVNLEILYVQNCNLNKKDVLNTVVNVVKIRENIKILYLQIEICEKHVITKNEIIHVK